LKSGIGNRESDVARARAAKGQTPCDTCRKEEPKDRNAINVEKDQRQARRPETLSLS